MGERGREGVEGKRIVEETVEVAPSFAKAFSGSG